jgi:hypothetical protein
LFDQHAICICYDQSKVRHYNSAQRREILQLTLKAYQGILAAFPSARVEDDENAQNGVSAPSDARARRCKINEHTIQHPILRHNRVTEMVIMVEHHVSQ